MAARVPIQGSLTFLDSRGNSHLRGDRRRPGAVDARAEEPHRGGAPSPTAIWNFGRVIDPYDPNRRHILDDRIPVDRLLVRDSIEGLMDRVYELQERIAVAEQERQAPNVSPERAKQLSDLIARNRDELRPFNELLARRRQEAEALKARARPRRTRSARPRPTRSAARRPRCTRGRSRSR